MSRPAVSPHRPHEPAAAAKLVPWERRRPRAARCDAIARMPATATRYELSERSKRAVAERRPDAGEGDKYDKGERLSNVEEAGSRDREPSDAVPPADPVTSTAAAPRQEYGDTGGELTALRTAVERLAADNAAVRAELDAQIKTSVELRRTLVAAAGDDLQTHVAALSDDRLRLAGNIDRMSTEAHRCSEAARQLEIDVDVWRTKFFAASIMTDELASWRVFLVGQLERCQRTLRSLVSTIQSGGAVDDRLSGDVHAVLRMRPAQWLATGGQCVCDESGAGRAMPMLDEQDRHCRYRNITITCCARCANNDIKIL